jgi:UV DNA damage endonuclease
MTQQPMRLGVPVKILGNPTLKSNDARRHVNSPHLTVSLGYLDTIFDYLVAHDIHMYRMASDLAPYATHPDLPQFHSMVRDSAADLAATGKRAKELGIRLSFHPSQFIVLNSPNPELVRKSIWDLQSQAEMLDLMELGPEAVLVVHVGGVYEDKEAARARWADVFPTMPEPVRRRLVLENDDLRFSASDVLWIHEHTGVRLIFDHQHFWCLNPEGADMRQTVEKFMATWPSGVRPKVHFSSPRTEMRQLIRKDRKTGKNVPVTAAPVWTGHADFVNPFEFATFMRVAAGFEFDVMLEAKCKDLALIKLRPDLIRYAPDVASRFGLYPADQRKMDADEASVMVTDES